MQQSQKIICTLSARFILHCNPPPLWSSGTRCASEHYCCFLRKVYSITML